MRITISLKVMLLVTILHLRIISYAHSVAILKLRLNRGKTSCHECHASFYIDDRVECIFADPKDLRLPLKGTVCPMCGLIQGEDSEHCVYCNTGLSSRGNYC